MQQILAVQPPLLSEESPDRALNCEVAIEPSFLALVQSTKTAGWTPGEAASAILSLATAHAKAVEALPEA